MSCPNSHRASTACRHTVSGSISLPSPGYFSPFPHGTCALSVAREYLALEGGPPRFPQGFSGPMVLGQCAQEAHTISVTGLSPSMADRSRSFTYHVCWSLPDRGVSRSSAPPQPRLANAYTLSRLVSLGCSRFARRYLGNRRLLSLPPGTEIFHFPGLASMRYGLTHGCDSITYHGFPHSGISGLTPVSGFPELIAAYYALRRLRAPRHPPYALPRLTIILPANVLFSYSVVKEQA